MVRFENIKNELYFYLFAVEMEKIDLGTSKAKIHGVNC